MITRLALIFFLLTLLLSACQPAHAPTQGGLSILVVESFLADMTLNVVGDRWTVDTLIGTGKDPHTYLPNPRDMARIAQADVLIINGAGFEAWLEKSLASNGAKARLIEASAGLQSREVHDEGEGDGHEHEGDPHFWLDPLLAQQYVLNIRDGLIDVDPAGKAVYTLNAQKYIEQLKELHSWIETQLRVLPAERRKLVTNHESFGYFADRYGFEVVGSILPSVTTGSSPSAQQLARLVDQIRTSGVKAIFLEGGANPQLAEQVAREANVKVVTGLYTHSTTPASGEAPTYIEMMKKNVQMMVAALKP